MEDTLLYSYETDSSLNMIYYGITNQILRELLNKELITEREYYLIDDLNKEAFHQAIPAV